MFARNLLVLMSFEPTRPLFFYFLKLAGQQSEEFSKSVKKMQL